MSTNKKTPPQAAGGIYTTYTVTGNYHPIYWVFKYHLNGALAAFIIQEGELTEKQQEWLFKSGEFPYHETQIKTWKNSKVFNLEIGEPDLSFETFWTAYNHKIKKQLTQKAWSRLSRKDKMDALTAIKAYDGYLKRKGTAKAHGATYINQRYWEDAYGSIH